MEENIFQAEKHLVVFNADSYTLKELRKAVGETLEEFSGHIQMSVGEYQRKEADMTKLTFDDAVKICSYCNISPKKLFPPNTFFWG